MWKLKKFSKKIAFIDDSKNYYYEDLENYCNIIKKKLTKNKSLILILSQNTIGAVVGYLSFISLKKVPIILDCDAKLVAFKTIIKNYEPDYIWMPVEKKINFFHNNYKPIFKLLKFKLLKKKKI